MWFWFMFLCSFDCKTATFPFLLFYAIKSNVFACVAIFTLVYRSREGVSSVAIKESRREEITKTKPKLPWECCLPNRKRPKIDKDCTRFSITLLLSTIRIYWFSFQSECVCICNFVSNSIKWLYGMHRSNEKKNEMSWKILSWKSTNNLMVLFDSILNGNGLNWVVAWRFALSLVKMFEPLYCRIRLSYIRMLYQIQTLSCITRKVNSPRNMLKAIELND